MFHIAVHLPSSGRERVDSSPALNCSTEAATLFQIEAGLRLDLVFRYGNLIASTRCARRLSALCIFILLPAAGSMGSKPRPRFALSTMYLPHATLFLKLPLFAAAAPMSRHLLILSAVYWR